TMRPRRTSAPPRGSSCRPTACGVARCGRSSPRRSSRPSAPPDPLPPAIPSSRPSRPTRCISRGPRHGSSPSSASGYGASSSDAQGYADLEVSPTDPRGFATFALAGVWLIVAGRALAARTDLRRLYAQLAITAGIDLVLLFIATVVGSTPLILVFGGLASVVLGPIFWTMTGRLLTAP